MRLKAYAIAGLLALSALPQALAQETPDTAQVPEEAEQLLWCGSAFRFMGAVAQTDQEAENAWQASETLTARAGVLLFEAGFDQDGGIAVLEAFDEQVVADLESGDIPFTSQQCLDALEP